ncbi:MAG: HEAT repeat domain-containing protein [Nitrospinae bacterium]|nr:HEAT repeat domain-containing protein [Nitrospinota bacterium]
MNELEFHVSRLNTDDFSVRRISAEMLGSFGDPSAIKPLLRLLGDDYWQVRNTVVDAIIKIRDKNSIEPLIEFLRDEDPGLRNSAMSVLHEMGEDVVAPLTKLLLTDKLEDIRIFCANTLGRIKVPHAMEGLAKGLEDKDENVRFACAEGLGRIGMNAAVLPLIKAMKNEETWSKFPYITALGLIGDELACPVLMTMIDDEILALPSIIALGQIGEISALPGLMGLLSKNSGDENACRAVVVAIARIEKRTAFTSKVERHGFLHNQVIMAVNELSSQFFIDLLVKMVLADDKLESELAFGLLRLVKNPLPVEKLFPLLDDDAMEEEARDLILKQGKNALEPVLRSIKAGMVGKNNQIIQILGVIGTADDVDALIPLLDSPLTETVCEALKAVGMLNATNHFEKIAGYLTSQNEAVQSASLSGISLFQGREWLFEKAMEMAGSENIYVRRSGYRVLGFTSLMSAADFLISRLSDESAICRAAAMQSLGYIGARDKKILDTNEFISAVGRTIIDEEKSVRIETVLAFARINNPTTWKMLLGMLEGEDREVQFYVIRAIGRCRIKEAVPALCKMLEFEDNTEQAILVCNALGAIGENEAAPFLSNFLDSPLPELAAEALTATALCGGLPVVDEITPYLGSSSWLVSSAAINALARLGATSAAGDISGMAQKRVGAEDGPILIRTAMKALAKIGTSRELGAALSFLNDPAYQYEAFAAICGILGREKGKFFDVNSIANPVARRLAIVSAGFLRLEDYRQGIILCLKDAYPSVRRAAALVLATSGGTGYAQPPTSARDNDSWVEKISKMHF